MKIGVFTVLYGGIPFEEALDKIAAAGVEALEIGTANYPASGHCDTDRLLADESLRRKFLNAIESRGLELNTLSCHGNPLHPDKKFARAHDQGFRKTVDLASKLGVKKIVAFSGCPGDHEGAKYPNWVTCPWPDDFLKILDWQWDKKVIPYWKDAAAYAKKRGVTKIAFEMHPGFVVYNPETCLRLRDAVGPILGANLDPSHLFWQGMDIPAVIRTLKGAIHHFHAKDCRIDPINTAKNGVLDTKHYGDESKRSWIFRTVGYGHDTLVWKDIVSNLIMAGYNDVLSIEHEDSLMSLDEGFLKGVEFLKQVVIKEKLGKMTWA